MRILIEEFPYQSEDISEEVLGELLFHDAEGKVSLDKVGYYFNPKLNDCVFILPKVLLEGERYHEKVFGHIEPRNLINPEKCTELNKEEHRFIYNLSVWIYRALSVYREHEYDRFGGEKKRPSIILYEQAPVMGRMKKRKASTFLDILLALQQWNQQNQQFVTFIVKNMHAGYNKINWTQTIAHSQAIISQTAGQSAQSVAYLNPVNKQRRMNFDEELLIIYYSILNYIQQTYGLPVIMNVNFPLIRGDKFQKYLDGQGKRRLRQIKYKYYSDKALELWTLCFAFFERPKSINLNVDCREYLLAKDFQIVFEAIIDELIAGDQKLPDGLKDQADGKIVDHMYQYRVLTNNESEDDVYYIGDSKYYKRGNQLDSKSISKQFTYARNVIQWNLDLFNDGTKEEQKGHIKLRDDVTEGYNVIPNFFISAQQNDLTASDKIVLSTDKKPYHLNRQFENRLFDRDTYMLAHYDVNFLFVLAMYGRNKESAKMEWRAKVRKMFREEIQEMLKKHFLFYAMTAHEDVEPNTFIQENFQILLGKVFQPFENRGSQQYFSLALRDPDRIVLKDKQKERELKAEVRNENDSVMFQLKQAFFVEPCALGEDPKTVLPKVEPRPHKVIAQNLLTLHYVENYPEVPFLVGGFREDQKEWMFGHVGGKVDVAYNVRLGMDIEGGLNIRDTQNIQAKFVLLYEFDKENLGLFKAYRVKDYKVKTKEDLMKEGYPSPHHDRYYCYVFDEEVNLGTFDIERIISTDRINYSSEIHQSKSISKKYPEGRPIFLRGSELLKFRITLSKL